MKFIGQFIIIKYKINIVIYLNWHSYFVKSYNIITYYISSHKIQKQCRPGTPKAHGSVFLRGLIIKYKVPKKIDLTFW